MIVMGIDPSMRSTGICVRFVWEDSCINIIYKLIVCGVTKKVKNFSHPSLEILEYEALPVKDLCSEKKELSKTKNVQSIINILRGVVREIKPDQIVIESIAFKAAGRLDELSGLNYAIRLLALEEGIEPLIVTPSTNKKIFTGNGQATKEMMVDAWKASEPSIDFSPLGKHQEDLADSYALSIVPSYTSLQ